MSLSVKAVRAHSARQWYRVGDTWDDTYTGATGLKIIWLGISPAPERALLSTSQGKDGLLHYHTANYLDSYSAALDDQDAPA